MTSRSLRVLAVSALLLASACSSVAIESLELGLRPHEVRARFGEPVQAGLMDRREGSQIRKMLIEEYSSPKGGRLQLIYSVPLDLDELAMQGDLAWARKIAPELATGKTIAALDPAVRKRINMRCARLLRYRRFEEATPK